MAQDAEIEELDRRTKKLLSDFQLVKETKEQNDREAQRLMEESGTKTKVGAPPDDLSKLPESHRRVVENFQIALDRIKRESDEGSTSAGQKPKHMGRRKMV